MANMSGSKQSADGQTGREMSARADGGELRLTTSVVEENISPLPADEQHVAWFELYFHSQGEQFPRQIGRSEFPAHGASAPGSVRKASHPQPEIVLSFKTDKPGTLYAVSYRTIRDQRQSARRDLIGEKG